MDVTNAAMPQSVLPLYAPDMFRPVYRPMEGERWRLAVVPMAINRGYWSGASLVTDMAVLWRDHDGIPKTWMSMTPMECESQEIGCRGAVGHTVVMGLGMGWCAANAALRDEVTRVTVVERDPEVIGFIRETGVFAQLPPRAAAKVTVVEGDALTYRTGTPADTLLADIWQPLNGDERVEEVRRMHANVGGSRVYFWGQEMVIARRARDTGRPLDTATVAAIIGETGLPLMGPELSDYPDLIARAAAHWMRDPAS